MGRNKFNRIKTNGAIPGRSGEPPAWAVATIVGVIIVVMVAFWLLDGRDVLPFGDSSYVYVGLIALPMVTLLLVALAVKLIEVRRAKSWTTTTGRVVRSTIAARRHQFSGDQTTVKNEPVVEYEFTANGKTWRGVRIAIGDDSGGANTEATLKRYPVGGTVTVYYDPVDPASCVLERGVPEGVGKGCLVLLALAAVFTGGGYFLLTTGMRFLEDNVPAGRAPVTMFAACFGVFVLWVFFAFRSYSKRAMSWPAVAGTVVSSAAERIEKVEEGRTRVYYAPAVEYSYRVHDIEYRSRTINLGMTASGSPSWAERVAAKYPVGRSIEVHHDPADPTVAALENPTGASWLILVVALACFALALFTAGVFQ